MFREYARPTFPRVKAFINLLLAGSSMFSPTSIKRQALEPSLQKPAKKGEEYSSFDETSDNKVWLQTGLHADEFE